MLKLRPSISTTLVACAALAAACASNGEREDDAANQDGGEATAVSEDGNAAGAAMSDATNAASSQDDEMERFLDEAFGALTLQEQAEAVQIERHLALAEELRAAVRLEDALAEIERALLIDPDNVQAKAMWNEVGTLLGLDAAETGELVQQLQDQMVARRQQLRIDAERGLQTGKMMLAKGDYDGAIAEFTLTLDHIRWNPYSVDWGGVQEETEALLAQAKAERDDANRVAREEAQRDALEQIRAEEADARARAQAAIDNLVLRAIESFEAARYEQAMTIAEEVLRKDPRNQRAQEIRDASFRAGRVATDERFVTEKREQFRRWEEEMAQLMIPWEQIVTLPDPDFWQRITEIRQRRRGIDLSQTVDPAELALRNKLAEERITFELEDEENLTNVVETIKTLTGLPLVVHPLAEEAALDWGAVYNYKFTNPISVEDALDIISEDSGEDVTWTVQHEAVVVTTIELARGRPIIYNHDIQDLVFGLTEFFGPRIDRIRLLDDMEDDDGGTPFGTIGERPTIIEEDDLATLVEENVEPESWSDDGVSITAEQGFLIVVHTPEIQAKVRDFLEDLRRFSSSLVTIESKFMTIEDNWLQELGVEFRGLDDAEVTDVTNGLEDQAAAGIDNGGSGTLNAAGPPAAGFFYDDFPDGSFAGATSNLWGSALGQAVSNVGGLTAQWTFLDDAQVSMILTAVEKSQNIEIINNQVLSVHNTQRAYVTVINQRAFIQDFDVEVAQFQAVADPQVNVLTEGVVLDVRPTIHYDRRYLTLEIQPTVAEVVNLRDFSTTLGGQTSAVEFQLPEIEVQSVFTTAIVPDGGTILLGGLSRLRNVERRSEVPLLANIPIAGFFFKEEGYSDEKQSLMIMLRAWITDVKEELDRY